MKTNVKSSLSFCIGILFISLLIAFKPDPKPFEGSINYSVDFPGIPDEAKAMMANSEMIMYMKGDKIRTDMNMTFFKNSTIIDYEKKIIFTLVENMNGEKYYKKDKLDEKKQEEPPNVKFNYKDETKTIAGYVCKKAEMIIMGKDSAATIVYYTEEIAPKKNPDKGMNKFSELKGFPLEFEQSGARGQTIKLMAKAVNKDAVPDSTFSIPEGYKEMTPKEFDEKQKTGMRRGG